jgi:hypothetical protein
LNSGFDPARPQAGPADWARGVEELLELRGESLPIRLCLLPKGK